MYYCFYVKVELINHIKKREQNHRALLEPIQTIVGIKSI